MKKRLFTLFLFILLAFAIQARTSEYYKNKRHEVRLSIGSVNDNYYYNSGYYNSYYSYILHYYSYVETDYKLQSSYRSPKKTCGVLGLSYFYHIPWGNGRFSAGGTFSYNSFKENYHKTVSDAKIGYLREHNLAFTPSIRYAWIAKPMFQIYSGIGLSLNVKQSKNRLKIDEAYAEMDYNDGFFEGVFQVTPVGFSVGKNMFAFGELNIGGRTGEFVGGVGYRF